MITPLSLSSIHFQIALETIIGSSQGSRMSERITPLRGKRRLKKIASASPMVNCPAIDPTVNRTVLSIAVENTEELRTEA